MAVSTRDRPSLLRAESSTSSDTDPDTIVVSSHPLRQLPTPSESSLDVSILDAQVVSMKEVSKGRARRVSRRLTKTESKDLLIETTDDEMFKNARTVSGETLVNMDNASQSTLVKEGIAALDLPWNMSQALLQEGKLDLLSKTSPGRTSLSALVPDIESEDGEAERLAKSSAKKAKMEENNKIWEQRRKAAEKQATRRSSRMPVLEKATELVSQIADSVLGKRKDRSSQSLPTSKAQNTKSSSEPDPKRRRISQAPPQSEEPPSPKAVVRRREKKWLASGLFAGQKRVLPAQNKRKSGEALELPKENWVLPLPMYAGERLLTHGRDFKLPFDIFSPLPVGQPKPDEWKKVNKNVFVGDAAQAWRVSKYEETSTCICQPETGCDQNCMNRYMYYECDSRNCNLTDEQCGNRNFEFLKQRVKKGGKYNVGVEVIKTEDRGYGVRSNRTFEPHQIIVEYTGEIITQEECEQRMRTMYKDNESYYLMLFDQNMIIDATRGSIARFVNHSCDPNCRMEKWTVNGKPRMALFAGNRGIMTGDELTYDYNFDPYSQKNVQLCRCGADNCRGFLGPRPKEERKQKSPEEDTKKPGKLAGVKRKLAEALGGGQKRVAKKAKVSPVKAKVYKSTPSKKNSPIKVRKVNLVRKAVSRKTSTTTVKGLIRRPSKLKQLVESAKSKTVSRKKMVNSKRVVSSSSSTALIAKGSPSGSNTAVSRSSSVREKAASVKSRVVRTVKGGQSGRSRSIRPVDQMDDV